MTEPPKITPAPNGPLIVKHPPKLTGTYSADVAGQPKIALCRYGASANKPFCDGAHVQQAFSSEPKRDGLRKAAVHYTGDVNGVGVTISYTPVLCTHAAECQTRARDVFDPSATPWIKPERGTLESIVDVIAACPSGALQVAIGETPAQHLTTGDVAIKVEKDGPYHVTNIPLKAEFNGKGASRSKFSLCRCRLSKNKPFCDGSHYDAKWSDEQTPPA